MRHEILIIDDEKDIRLALRHGLAGLEVAISEAANGFAALDIVRHRPISVALVDLGLPDMPGLQLITGLRELAMDLHVIVVSGQVDHQTQLRCFGAGADDVVAKPFDLQQLRARVGVALRRRRAAGDGRITFGEMEFDLSQRTVEISGEVVALSGTQFDLLAFLATHPERVFTPAQLARALSWETGTETDDAKIESHLRAVRQRISSAGGALDRVVEIPNHGFRFDPHPETAYARSPSARAVLDAKGVVQVFVDRTGTIVDLSDGALEFFGALATSELCGRDVLDLIAPSSRPAMLARADQARTGEWPLPQEMLLQRLDGVPIAAEMVSRPVEGDRDIAELSLWPVGSRASQVLQNVLTGITSEVSDAVIVLTPDLHIRALNPAAETLYGWTEAEVFGRHLEAVVPALGPTLLIEVAEALRLRGTWVGQIEQRHRDGRALHVRATATAVRDGGGRAFSVVAVLRPDRSELVEAGLGLTRADIRAALTSGEIVPHYQPIVRLHDARVLGTEALARWERPDGSVVPAAEFISVVEKSDLIHELGEVVLRQAVAQLAAWNIGGRRLRMAVNVSAQQLLDPEFPDMVRSLLAAHALAPGSLWLEVTETTLVEDIDWAESSLRAVVAAGALVSIDDFGTGWASLTYLSRFPVAGIKIDRSFVTNLGTGSQDEAIIRSLRRLACDLSLTLVAEGVETPDQRQALSALGCTIGQGYLFGRPAAAEDVELGVDAAAPD